MKTYCMPETYLTTFLLSLILKLENLGTIKPKGTVREKEQQGGITGFSLKDTTLLLYTGLRNTRQGGM